MQAANNKAMCEKNTRQIAPRNIVYQTVASCYQMIHLPRWRGNSG
ncbi:hypothetical protein SAMN04515620_13714 [Collimonas sp. OK607]|nr:hypothetical protein SAMN04515620_13714 [Collimonas sp. OK607]